MLIGEKWLVVDSDLIGVMNCGLHRKRRTNVFGKSLGQIGFLRINTLRGETAIDVYIAVNKMVVDSLGNHLQMEDPNRYLKTCKFVWWRVWVWSIPLWNPYPSHGEFHHVRLCFQFCSRPSFGGWCGWLMIIVDLGQDLKASTGWFTYSHPKIDYRIACRMHWYAMVLVQLRPACYKF